jgi:tetratricopeptide (TPR) repeat protein
MRKSIIFFVLLISCPRPEVKAIPEPDYVKEAQRTYRNNPLYAYTILKNMTAPTASYSPEHAQVLLQMYIDQREYGKAERLLDSTAWSAALPGDMLLRVALNARRWDKVLTLTSDDLLKGIAHYNLADHDSAVEYLKRNNEPTDYRVMYLAKAYYARNEFDSALSVLGSMDSVDNYLSERYQNLLFEMLMAASDTGAVMKDLDRLKDASLRDYVMLKVYEKQNQRAEIKETAWRLIKKYPRSSGAYYALPLVKPLTAAEFAACGRVYYYQKKYDDALKQFQKTPRDSEVNYLMGMIAYDRNQFEQALVNFRKSSWTEALYYRGRIYEDQRDYARAIGIYDSLCNYHKKSRYATRALKRKAFLLEDIGDTLSAVQVFLQVKEKGTRFRAAMQLYRLGRLDQVVSVLDDSTEPGFLYWQIRAKDRLSQPTDSLKELLYRRYPLSYYSLFRSGKAVVFDSLPLCQWVQQWGDTAMTFDHEDSAHVGRAVRYFTLNDLEAAAAELEMIEDMSAQDLCYLMCLCRLYGADRLSVNFGLKIKALAELRGIRSFPREFLSMIYPVRYAFSIMEQKADPILTLALIWQESLFDPGATSTADARGLMQIIPSTGRLIARDLGIDQYSLYDPETSIRFGSYYYGLVTRDFNSVPLALAAYNAGPVKVKKWLVQDPNAELDEFIELIPYSETQNYVKLIMARQIIYNSLYGDYSGVASD